CKSIDELPSEALYDTIVCTPPVGVMGSIEVSGDAFGGEVVQSLLNFLSRDGTLYWITMRGVLLHPRAKQTLTNLTTAGVHLTGSIEIAPGVFPGSAIEGLMLIYQRKMPTKRFVGNLRDVETAEPMARAFAAGPTRGEGASWAWVELSDSRLFS